MMALVEMAAAGDFTRAYAITLPPLVVGVTIVSVLGVALGVAMGLSAQLRVDRPAPDGCAADRADRRHHPAADLFSTASAPRRRPPP